MERHGRRETAQRATYRNGEHPRAIPKLWQMSWGGKATSTKIPFQQVFAADKNMAKRGESQSQPIR